MSRQIPAVDGWFTSGPEAALVGHRCDTCGTYAFPFRPLACPNPACEGMGFSDVELTRSGTIWSYTDAKYQPPAPFVGGEEYRPVVQAAVALAREGLVVLGQVSDGYEVDQLAVGMEVRLVVEPLYIDEATGDVRTVYRWKPVDIEARSSPRPTPVLAAEGGAA